MTEAGFAERRDRVREAVIEPLVRMGMRKPKAMSAEDHEAMLGRLADRLAYLDPKWHAALRDWIERNAVAGRSRSEGRPPRDIWPSEVAILNCARALARADGQPGLVTRLTATWMASADGQATWARSPFEASALFDYLQKGYPPGDAGRAEILDRASALRAKHVEFTRRAADGVALPEQLAWLERWERRAAFLAGLVGGEPCGVAA